MRTIHWNINGRIDKYACGRSHVDDSDVGYFGAKYLRNPVMNREIVCQDCLRVVQEYPEIDKWEHIPTQED